MDNRPPLPDRGLIRSGRVNRHRPCPACGAIDQCIALPTENGQGIQVWCVRSTLSGGVFIPGYGFRGGVTYYKFGVGSTIQASPSHPSRLPPLALPKVRDMILRGIEKALPLTSCHKEKLIARGYTIGDCSSLGTWHFASLPEDISSRYHLIWSLIAQLPLDSENDLLGTYGFQREKEGLIAFLPQVVGSALIEFIIDEYGIYKGFQYAPDTPTLRKGKPVKRLSPVRQESYELYHVARSPHDTYQYCYHVEGIHKANLVAQYCQSSAIASIGVGNYSGAIAGAKALDPDKIRTHILCIDSDHQDQREETRLVSSLRDRLGYTVVRGRWQQPYNGPDDAVVAGAPIHLYPYLEEIFDE